MITVMRKHHKILMIFITVLVCISFSWSWNKTDFAQMGNGTVGKIYDRNISQVGISAQHAPPPPRQPARDARARAGTDRSARKPRTKLREFFLEPDGVAPRSGANWGSDQTTTEIANAVKALPAFDGEHGFDLARYTDFADHALAPMGFSEAQIEELAADQIILERVKKILSAGVNVPEAEMRNSYEQAYAKMDVSVVRFRFEDFAQDAQINDDGHREILSRRRKRS